MELPAKVGRPGVSVSFPCPGPFPGGKGYMGYLKVRVHREHMTVKMQLAIQIAFCRTGLAEFMGKDDNNLQNVLLSFMSNLVYT